MKARLIKLCSFVAFLSIFLPVGYGEAASLSPHNDSLIETFDFFELPEAIEGCSCIFRTDVSSKPSQGLIFASDRDRRIWMKLDGKFTILTLKESKFGEVGQMGTKKIGDKLNYVYTSGDVTVNIEMKATSVCPPVYTDCEGQSFSVTFTALKGSHKQTVVANGNCGC